MITRAEKKALRLLKKERKLIRSLEAVALRTLNYGKSDWRKFDGPQFFTKAEV